MKSIKKSSNWCKGGGGIQLSLKYILIELRNSNRIGLITDLLSSAQNWIKICLEIKILQGSLLEKIQH